MTSGNDTQALDRVSRDVALLAAYLLSSCRGLIDEPDDYGVLRCLDAARRALRIIVDAETGASGLIEVHKRLDQFMYAPMGSEADLPKMLDELCLKLSSALTS